MQILSKYVGSNYKEKLLLRDLSEISSGGGAVETEGGSQLFETQKREGSWKNLMWSCRGSPTEEKGSSLFGKKTCEK